MIAVLSRQDVTPERALTWVHAIVEGPPMEMPSLATVPPRLVRARLALCLRLQRRAEAWERARARDEADHARDVAWERKNGSMHCPHGDIGPDDWAEPPTYRNPLTYLGDEGFHEALRAWIASPPSHRPWRPLWVSAPPWSPVITPAMRRGER